VNLDAIENAQNKTEADRAFADALAEAKVEYKEMVDMAQQKHWRMNAELSIAHTKAYERLGVELPAWKK